MSRIIENVTNRPSLRRRDEAGRGSGEDTEQERFRLRGGCVTSSSLSLESAECVREGTGDRLREELGVWQAICGDCGVVENTNSA